MTPRNPRSRTIAAAPQLATTYPAGHHYATVEHGTYTPEGADPDNWATARPVAIRLLADDHQRRPGQEASSSRTRRSAICRYLTWVAKHEPDILTSDPLDTDAIRRYLATDAMQRRSSHRSRVAVRSILTSFQGPRPASVIEPAGSIAPTPDDLFDKAMVETSHYRNPITRANTRALLLLARGAGCDGADLRWITGNDITHKPGAGTWVNIRNPKSPRTVPVLARFASQLEDLAIARGDRPMLAADSDGPINSSAPSQIAGVISRSLERAKIPGRIQVEGLRKAWIAEHIAASAPLLTLMQAAGVRSLRTFDDLLTEHAPLPATNPIHLAYELGGITPKRKHGPGSAADESGHDA